MQPNGPTQHPQAGAVRSLAATGASPAVIFPGEDGGRSLAEMVQRDLDAALQLLADRAQYITGASGAAIALRRNGMNDMLCRASTGSNAPELGALLSTEFGLSGESVRTRKALRCDDAERDARVNHDVCRQLGIASVVVMPVVHDDEVLGVFELFSGQAHAFGDRDVSAVQRLSEMVETAVRMAHVTATLPDRLNGTLPLIGEPIPAEDPEQVLDVDLDETQAAEMQATAIATAHLPVAPVAAPPAQASITVSPPPSVAVGPDLGQPAAEAAQTEESPPPKKPLFWSASVGPESPAAPAADQSHVPPALRSLKKCEACGFPVSSGRVLCVECEEKKWKGSKRP